MAQSNRDRLKFLRQRVNELAGEIEKRNKGKEYLDYLDQLRSKSAEPRVIDEIEWDLLLPAEREKHLLNHYHTMRSELLEMTRKLEEPDTIESVSKWLENPWLKTAVAAVSLIETAKVLYFLLNHTGLFLHVQEDNDDPLKV